MSRLFIITFTFIFLLLMIVFSVSASNLPVTKQTTLDDSIWHLVDVDINLTMKNQQLTLALQQSSPAVHSLLGQRGGALAKLPFNTHRAGDWYVMPIANFVDQGKAYWQDELGNITEIADFSQSQHQNSSILMHGQAFKLHFNKPSSGFLWIYLNAKHYPTPVHISVVPAEQFIGQQFIVNSFTISTITIMSTLALMAWLLYLRTKQKVAFFCSGYIGLHALGWALASGLLQSTLPSLAINTTYGGMYLFPFAIACASYFAYYLFGFEQSNRAKNRFLVSYANLALGLGIVMCFLPFTWVFYLSHLLASIWVGLSLYVGYRMLSSRDFRAKYFFTGNVIYSLSLIFYILTHLAIIDSDSPEMVVLIALSIDCVCILLSLSEWLRLKQQELQTAMHQSRFDALTKVGNRLLLNEQIDKLDTDYLIVFIDCDGIKQLNDQLGHAEGDVFLIYVAKLMKAELADLGQVFRTGGDEFIWLCTADEHRSLSDLKTISQQLLNKIDKLVVQRWPQSGISYGIATNVESNSTHHCLSLADSRMYEFKSKNKATRQSQFKPVKVNMT